MSNSQNKKFLKYAETLERLLDQEADQFIADRPHLGYPVDKESEDKRLTRAVTIKEICKELSEYSLPEKLPSDSVESTEK